MVHDIRIPAILNIGGGALGQTASVARALGIRNPLVVTDPGITQLPFFRGFCDSLSTQSLPFAVFSGTVADPTVAVVQAGLDAWRNGSHDSLIALGGGSSLDTAKAIGVLAGNGGSIQDYKVPHPIPRPLPPLIAIPTTAGTGSEVSRFTVVTDPATNEKMLIAGAALVPAAAIVDFQLTLTMPLRLTADTGTDALTHCIEACVSRKANPFSDAFAFAAMQAIWKWLPVACMQPTNTAAREAMMLAATQAGLAFSNASVALVHGMSRPIGAMFHVAHGLSNAMLLPAVTAFSVRSAPDRYAACARAMGLATRNDPDVRAAQTLVAALYERNRELQIPSPREYGIAERDYMQAIPQMVEQALASGSPHNNPRIPTPDEIAALYREVWK
jgi:alcohol dehydrogenase class IV